MDDAVRLNEKQQLHEIAAKPIDSDRWAQFLADLSAARMEGATIEAVFRQAAAVTHVPADSPDAPQKERIGPYLPFKGPFTATQNWMPYDARDFGVPLAADVGQRLLKELESAPENKLGASAAEPASVIDAIRDAARELGDNVVVLLVGDWADLLIALTVQQVSGWQDRWLLKDMPAPLFLRGSLDKNPVIQIASERREIFVVDPASWGSLIRAGAGNSGEELQVDIKTIDEERARELLRENPDLFKDEGDEDERILALMNRVELEIWQRVDFIVKDPTRARRIRLTSDPEPPSDRRRARRKKQ